MRYLLRLLAAVLLIIDLSSCKQNVTQNDYPDADAVYLKISKEYTLNDDGSMEYHYSHKLKLFSYLAFNSRYGETFVIYNPAFQKLIVNKSVTTNEKGAETKSPENAFNEVLPHFAADAAAFNGLREMVITHTGLEKNATIDLDYNISTQKEFMPALMSNEVLNTSSPVREYEITVKIPKGKALHYKILNSDAMPDSTADDKYVTYKWKLNEIAQQPMENFQQTDNSHLVRLIFSTSDNLSSVIDNTIKQPAFKYELNGEMKMQANEIKAANKSELNIALGLQKKVVDEFNYYPVPSNYIGYKCRTAVEVWKSNGGTELEKAVLLNSLLLNADIKSQIIAVANPYFAINDNINLLYDNYFIQATLKNNEVIYLSPIHVNDISQIYELSGDLYYPLESNAKPTAFPVVNYNNSIGVKGSLTLKAENILEGKINATITDKLNPYFKYSLNPESSKAIFNNVKEAKQSFLSRDKSITELTIENKKAFQKEKNYMFFNLPEANGGLSSWGLNMLTEKRNTAVELPSNLTEKYSYEIQLADNVNLLLPKIEYKVINKQGSVNISIEQKGKILSVDKEIVIYNKIVDTKNYNDLKALLEPWLNKKYRELVLVTK